MNGYQPLFPEKENKMFNTNSDYGVFSSGSRPAKKSS